MPLVECESGRTYLLELGTLILEQMSPSVMEEVTPEMMKKMADLGTKLGREELEDMTELEALGHLNLTDDEMLLVKRRLKDSEMGPRQLKFCLRKVDGLDPSEIPNPFDDDNPYGSLDAFIDQNEELVDDLPELIPVMVDKLEKYAVGATKRGESRPSSKQREKKKQ